MTNEELDRRERELRIKREELRLERSQKVNGILKGFGKLFKWIIFIIVPIITALITFSAFWNLFRHCTELTREEFVPFVFILAGIIGILVFFGLKKLMFNKK